MSRLLVNYGNNPNWVRAERGVIILIIPYMYPSFTEVENDPSNVGFLSDP
jgi:hypothetical protein